MPRMWVEEDKGHSVSACVSILLAVYGTLCVTEYLQACMLTFYPEFEVDNISENEIIFILDLSNSMKVSPSTDKVAMEIRL